MHPQIPEIEPSKVRGRIALAVAGLVVVAVVVAGYIGWKHARLLTHEKMARALSAEPATRADLVDGLGTFTDWKLLTTGDLDSPAALDALLHDSEIPGEYHWYEGRGGEGAVERLFLIGSLPPQGATSAQMEGSEPIEDMREYCIFVGEGDAIVGWVELTGGPTVIDLLKRAVQKAKDKEAGETESGAGEDDGGKAAE